MLKIMASGDLFQDDAEILVCPANGEGVAGAGLALEFKKRFKEGFQAYQVWCKTKTRDVGEFLVVKTPKKTVCYFVTKKYWKDSSDLHGIRVGLDYLTSFLMRENCKSISFPALGCGLGKLRWSDVKLIMEKSFERCKKIQVNLYYPQSWRR